MPNGNPRFQDEELPGLEQFFAQIADTLNSFATAHNLRLDRYYHQFPSWRFGFQHPRSGVGSIEVEKHSNESIIIYSGWWLDDYDHFTRSIKRGETAPVMVCDEGLRNLLEAQLSEILSWQPGEWTEVATGYEQAWRAMGREYVERDPERYPVPKP